jgi:alkylation response protein AidB-like acyl-CoA dehydrogenase
MTTDLDLSPTTAADETVRPLFRAEHEELRATARAFVEREIVPNVEEWERAEDFPRELFRRVGDAGFLGLKFDGSVGGSGPDLLAAAVWTEELARCLSGGVAADLGASTDLAALYVDRSGTDELRQGYVRPTVAGEMIGALAITEPGAGSDVAGITTRARRDGDGWVIDGEKVFITNGAWCDWVVVAAKVTPEDGAPSGDPHGQITLFVVDADGQGSRGVGWGCSGGAPPTPGS